MGMAAIAKNQTGNKNKNKSDNKAKGGQSGKRTNLWIFSFYMELLLPCLITLGKKTGGYIKFVLISCSCFYSFCRTILSLLNLGKRLRPTGGSHDRLKILPNITFRGVWGGLL